MKVTVAGTEINIHDREQWQNPNEPITSGNRFNKASVGTAVAHWPGASSSWHPPQSNDAVAQDLRSMQHDYLVNRGYSLGYNFVISQTEFPDNIWEVRGLDYRNAANNGDKPPYNQSNWNNYTVSMQYQASESYGITPDQEQAGRYLLSYLDTQMGLTLDLLGHRDSDGTTCPGDVIYSMLHELAIRPVDNGEIEEEDMPLTDQDINKIAKAVWDEILSGDEEDEKKPAGWRLRQIQGTVRQYLGGWKESNEVPDRTLLKQIHDNTKD